MLSQIVVGRIGRAMAVLAWVCVALGMRSSSAANAIETADGAPSITPSEQIRDVGGWRSYERYDGYSGNLRLSFHDIHIPGSAGMSIDLYRTYSWTDYEIHDPGFRRSLNYYYGQDALACGTRCSYPVFVFTTTSETDYLGHPYVLYSFSYEELLPPTGAIRPGGVWRFAVGPEIEVAVVPRYFQSVPNRTNDTFPLAQRPEATTDFIYNGVCGITPAPTLNGVRAELPTTLRFPDGRVERMARIVSGTSGVLRSSSNWELRCASPGATRFSLFSPDGTRYDLGQEVRANAASSVARWLPTKQTNVASNEWIKVDYDTSMHPLFAKPSKVYASDGRTLSFKYDQSYGNEVSRSLSIDNWNITMPVAVEPVLTTATTSLGAWTYDYGPPSNDKPVPIPARSLYFHPPAYRALNTVTLPDNGGTWRFGYGTSWNIADAATRNSPTGGDQRLSNIAEPNGGSVIYTFENGANWSYAGHAQEAAASPGSLPAFCGRLWLASGGYPQECQTIHSRLAASYLEGARIARQQRDYRLATRATSDGGVWTFGYVKGSAVGEKDVTTITRPDGATEILSYFGDWYFPVASLPTNTVAPPATSNSGWQVGLLAEHTVNYRVIPLDSRGGRRGPGFDPVIVPWPTLTPDGRVRITTYEWDKRAYAPGPYWLRSKNWHVDDQYYAPVLKQKTVVSDGVTYTTSYDTTTLTAYGSPTSVVELGPDPSAPSKRIKRTTTIGYYTDTNLWIIDRPQQETVTTAQQ